MPNPNAIDPSTLHWVKPRTYAQKANYYSFCRKYKRTKRQLAAGRMLCTNCGKGKRAKNRMQCQNCLDKDRIKKLRIRQELAAAGRCIRCGRKLTEIDKGHKQHAKRFCC